MIARCPHLGRLKLEGMCASALLASATPHMTQLCPLTSLELLAWQDSGLTIAWYPFADALTGLVNLQSLQIGAHHDPGSHCLVHMLQRMSLLTNFTSLGLQWKDQAGPNDGFAELHCDAIADSLCRLSRLRALSIGNVALKKAQMLWRSMLEMPQLQHLTLSDTVEVCCRPLLSAPHHDHHASRSA